MLNLMGNERNLETRRERREFQRRVIYFASGFLTGAILTIIALSPMIRK